MDTPINWKNLQINKHQKKTKIYLNHANTFGGLSQIFKIIVMSQNLNLTEHPLPDSQISEVEVVLPRTNPKGSLTYSSTEMKVHYLPNDKAIGKYDLSDEIKKRLPENVGNYLEDYEVPLNNPEKTYFTIQQIYQKIDIDKVDYELLLTSKSLEDYFQQALKQGITKDRFDQLPESTESERQAKFIAAELILIRELVPNNLNFSTTAYSPKLIKDGNKLKALRYLIRDRNQIKLRRIVEY